MQYTRLVALDLERLPVRARDASLVSSRVLDVALDADAPAGEVRVGPGDERALPHEAVRHDPPVRVSSASRTMLEAIEKLNRIFRVYDSANDGDNRVVVLDDL